MLIYLVACTLTLLLLHVYGEFLNSLLQRLSCEPKKKVPFSVIQVCGMLIISVLFGFYSLVAPLDYKSVLLAFVIGFVIFFYKREFYLAEFKVACTAVAESKVAIKLIGLMLILYVTVIAVYPPINGDTGMYHAQAIRWHQEVGVVPGLYHLYSQPAQSWFIPESLFSYTFMQHSPIHVMNGIVFFLLGIWLLRGVNALLDRRYSFASVLQVVIFPAFVVFISEDVASLSPDLAVSALALLLLCYVVEEIEFSKFSFLGFSVVSVLSVYAITIKLSATPLLLLPLYLLLIYRDSLNHLRSRYVAVLGALGICVLILVPWLASNVLLTGYLIFPFPYIDLFEVDWKPDAEEVKRFARYVYEFAKNPQKLPIERSHWYSWMGAWLTQTLVQERALFFFSILALVNMVIVLIQKHFVSRALGREHYEAYWAVTFASLTGILFWFLSAPAFRFGYGYLIAFVAAQIAFWVFLAVRGLPRVWLGVSLACPIVSMVLTLAFIELRHFYIPRVVSKQEYTALQASAGMLDGYYDFDPDAGMYRLRVFLPTSEKFKVVSAVISSGYIGGDGLARLKERVLLPAPYPVKPMYKEKLGNVEFYRKAIVERNAGGWYAPFPFSVHELTNIELRGEKLSNGFRRKR